MFTQFRRFHKSKKCRGKCSIWRKWRWRWNWHDQGVRWWFLWSFREPLKDISRFSVRRMMISWGFDSVLSQLSVRKILRTGSGDGYIQRCHTIFTRFHVGKKFRSDYGQKCIGPGTKNVSKCFATRFEWLDFLQTFPWIDIMRAYSRGD